MTTREFFTAILSADVADDVKEFASQGIAKLDSRNQKRAEKPSKTALANEPIKASIVDLLAGGGRVASEIGVALDISTNKASALCRQLVEGGKLTVTDIKVKGKGSVKYYSLAKVEA